MWLHENANVVTFEFCLSTHLMTTMAVSRVQSVGQKAEVIVALKAHQRAQQGEFTEASVVQTLHFHCQGYGFNSCLALQASWCEQKI